MERLETPQPAPTPPVQAPHPSPSRLIEAKARVQQARQARQPVTMTTKAFGQLLVRANTYGVPLLPDTMGEVIKIQRELGRR